MTATNLRSAQFWFREEIFGQKKIEAPKGLYLLGNLAGQNIPHHKPSKLQIIIQI